MPLIEGAINEIMPFAEEGLEAAGDLLSLEDYKAHPMRARGHLAGLALRELQNRASRQAAHMAAGAAQFLANRCAPGIKDDGDLDKVEAAWLEVITGLIATAPNKYTLCEFYYFRHPTLKPGFQPAQGGLLPNAAELYPEAWAYLQTTEGQLLCKTEAEWQAMTTATWATLADGAKVGWNGIGGAPFYAPNTATGALRLPDLRGMYAEAAGFDSLGVGGVHGDGIRNMVGTVRFSGMYASNASGATRLIVSGAFSPGNVPTLGSLFQANTSATQTEQTHANFSAANVVPTAAKNQPRAWGALACVYLGLPAS
ncbi:MAG: hypothetical protein FWG04_02560 [Desulfovibrionaceae bacterium]|nr:hypothetical protein [Desulfovibrionaceae bacterium]